MGDSKPHRHFSALSCGKPEVAGGFDPASHATIHATDTAPGVVLRRSSLSLLPGKPRVHGAVRCQRDTPTTPESGPGAARASVDAQHVGHLHQAGVPGVAVGECISVAQGRAVRHLRGCARGAGAGWAGALLSSAVREEGMKGEAPHAPQPTGTTRPTHR